jgi:autotransporter-associated beta strand protein
MNRIAILLAVLVLAPVSARAGNEDLRVDTQDGRAELVRRILARLPEWPNTEVEIPIGVYSDYLRALWAGPVLPTPPEPVWIQKAAWNLKLAGEETVFEVTFDIVRLPGAPASTLKLLPADLVWRDVTVDGKAVELRRADDGWFHFDPTAAGRFAIAARTTIKRTGAGDSSGQYTVKIPRAVWNTASVESDGAWEVRFAGSPLPVVGGEKGTRGTVGLVPADQLQASWQRPQPPVHRQARIETESTVGWTLGDGVHQVRAILDLRLWGGETEEFTVNLPAGADRVSITGPDVREVQVKGTDARVFLRGPITQRTRLAVSFDVPRPATGKMTLPAFGVAGAANRGGSLAIAGGAGAVILETDSQGLTPVAIHDMSAAVRGLLAAPPVYAYQLAAGWEARIDVVGLAEFPVRETLVDSALYTVLYRPDGQMMTKVVYEVRNRNQQYMKVELPAGAQLVVAHVNEQQKNLAQGPDTTMYVPLEKSVLTTAGLVSFPVELVYVMAGEPLAAKGKMRLPLPRTDLPVAYARCALMLPDGLKVSEWGGPLREVGKWSSETAQREFEYGSGHLAAAPKVEVIKRQGPDVVKAFGGPVAATDIDKARLAADMDRLESEMAQQKMIQGRNNYRAGVDFYNRGNYDRARELFNKVLEVAPESTEAENSKKYLGNVDIALGKTGTAQGDRSAKAATKAIQMNLSEANSTMLGRQQDLLQIAENASRKGDEETATAAYKVAVNLSDQLKARGEEVQEQDAVTRQANDFLRQQEAKTLSVSAVQVYKLQNADAANVAGVLNNLFAQSAGAGKPSGAAGSPSRPQVQVDANTNSIIVSGSEADSERVATLIRQLDSGAAGGLNKATAKSSPQPPPPVPSFGTSSVSNGAEKSEPGGLVKGGAVSLTKSGAGTVSFGGVSSAFDLNGQSQSVGALSGKGQTVGGNTVSLSGTGGLSKTTASAITAATPPAGEIPVQVQADRLEVNAPVPPVPNGEAGAKAPAAQPQVEMGQAMAEQQLKRGKPLTQGFADNVDNDGDAGGGAAGETAIGSKAGGEAQKLNNMAVQAQDLAKQGRLVEAQALLQKVEKAGKETLADGREVRGSGAALDMQANNDTIANLTLAGGSVVGSGAALQISATPKADYKDGAAKEVEKASEARYNVEKAREEIQQQSEKLDRVNLNVKDIAHDANDEKKLAEFVATNYNWAINSGANTYSGNTTVNAGRVSLNTASNNTMNSFSRQGGAQNTPQGGYLVANSTPGNVAAGNLPAGIVVLTENNRLSQAGPGNADLSGFGYAGHATRINDTGTLQTGNQLSGNVGTITINSGSVQGMGQITANNTFNNAGTLVLSRGGNTTVGGDVRQQAGGAVQGTNTFGGTITGSVNLIKTGGGTQTLSNASTYTGTTTVNAGTLVVNGAISGGGHGVTRTGNGTLVLSNTANNYTGAANVSGGAVGFVGGGGGTFDVTGAAGGNLYSAEVNNHAIGVDSNTLRVGGAQGSPQRTFIDSGTTVMNITGGGQTFTGRDTATLSGVITNGGLSRTTTGTVVLSGASGYTGATNYTLSAGGGVLEASGVVSSGAHRIRAANEPLSLGANAVPPPGDNWSDIDDLVSTHEKPGFSAPAEGLYDRDGFRKVPLASNVNVGSGATLTWGGNAVTGTINGTVNFHAGMYVDSGTVRLGIPSMGNISGVGSTFDGGTTSWSNTGEFIAYGRGNQSVAGANTYSGTTIVSNGILNVQNGAASGLLYFEGNTNYTVHGDGNWGLGGTNWSTNSRNGAATAWVDGGGRVHANVIGFRDRQTGSVSTITDINSSSGVNTWSGTVGSVNVVDAPMTIQDAARPSSGNAPAAAPRTIVFVVDRSGSMVDSMDYVKRELKSSIGDLPEDASFDVVFMSAGQPLEMPARQLVPATQQNKLQAAEFIDSITAQGETQSSPAISRALSLRPDVLYILTDAQLSWDMVGLVRRLNADGRTTVHTVGLLYKGGEAVLKEIALQNGGEYRFVPQEDLEAAAATAVQPQGPAVIQNTGSNNEGIWNVQGSAEAVQVNAGNLAVVNDKEAVARVQELLTRLRSNLGQRVPVGSMNILVKAEAAKTAGITWKQGNNDVRYAVANEGQLLSLLDVEQRQVAQETLAGLRREARQDAIVGTDALIANSGTLNIAHAADDNNGLRYNGNDVTVQHDDYLLLDNGGYLTAVKTGRMQHWSEEVEPVRFPGVPAIVMVPVVGHTVKFEKTLLDASDILELVMDYTWQGEEK